MRIHMPGLDMTLEAGADLSTHQFKFVVPVAPVAGGQQARVNVAGAAALTMGVLQNKPPAAGQGAVVRVGGRSKVVVDGNAGAIAVGDALATDGSGRGVKTVAAGAKIGGIALEASTAANDIIDCLLCIGSI